MKCFRNALTVLGWSAATCGLALAVAMPGSLNATDQVAISNRSVGTPMFEMEGVLITASFAGHADQPAAVAPGAALPITIVATNPTDASVTIRPTIRIDGTPVPSPMARTLPMPTPIWQQEQTITLGAGETRTIELTRTVAMPETSHASIVLANGSNSVTLARVMTPVDTNNRSR